MHHFFAYMSRMKHIFRWGLMRNTQKENDLEHAAQAAMIAQALAVIKNRRFGGSVSPEKVAVLALYHDAGEVITGDVATPIKHFNPGISKAMGEIENMARGKLAGMLPEDLKGDFAPYILGEMTKEEKAIVKAADKICAYVKCLEELKAGNGEFACAKAALEESLMKMEAPEVGAFLEEFVPSFALTIDELG